MGRTIGFIGLGTMGGHMCRRLLAADLDVVAFDRAPERSSAAERAGAQCAATAAECAAAADLLLTSLPHPADVQAVMVDAGGLAALRPGALWVDLTTNDRALLATLAARAPAGVSVIDAPVTGAVDGARNGTLTIFVGGAAEPVERATAVLTHLGSVIPCGPLGTGTVVKLVTNQLWFIAAAGLGEAFAVGVSHGVALDVLWRAICCSVADSFVARHDAPSIFAGHYDPSFPLALCLKDLRLLAELQAGVGTDLPMTDAARDTFVRAADRYGRDAGELHVARRIEDDAQLSFRIEGAWTAPWEADTTDRQEP